jgi:hypothetical protein
MSTEFACSIKRIRFDENYQPADNTRLTTNFANLARGESREQNLRNTLRMINNRFNALAQTDNPNGDRYSLEIDIISADLDIEGNGKTFPIIEMLKSTITDHHTHQRIEGMIGNSFSSYVRDYDFSVVLKEHNKENSTSYAPEGFGDLHGKLYQYLVNSETFKAEFNQQPVICLSVSTAKKYHRTTNEHPVLGVGIRPFRVFRFLHFLWSKCREMKKKSLKRAFQCVFLARRQEFFSFQIDTISPYYNINR